MNKPEWQPIETAPKTSSSILVWVPENKCTFCVTWIGPQETCESGGWSIFGGGWRICSTRDMVQRPSHWMPLPEPPTQENGSGTITTKDGLLYRNGKVIGLPEADRVAREGGFDCAVHLVRTLEGKDRLDALMEKRK